MCEKYDYNHYSLMVDREICAIRQKRHVSFAAPSPLKWKKGLFF